MSNEVEGKILPNVGRNKNWRQQSDGFTRNWFELLTNLALEDEHLDIIDHGGPVKTGSKAVQCLFHFEMAPNRSGMKLY